jgi:uncharacterized membrane protein YbhN (UPF0104 family)
VLVAIGLLAFSLSRLDPATLADTRAQIASANPFLYAAALCAYYTAFPIRAMRWRILLLNAGVAAANIPRLRDLGVIIYLSWFANALTPAKLGDLYRGWLLRRESGAKWSSAMGTIVAERLLDVVVLIVLMITTGLLAYRGILANHESGVAGCDPGGQVRDLTPVLMQLFAIAGIGLLVIVVGLFVFARFGAHLERFLPGRLGHVYQTFSGALVLSFGRMAPLLSLSLGGWAAEALRFYLVGLALGYELPLPLVIFVSLLSAFMTTIPVTPGGVGFEIVLAGALCLNGYPAAAAWALTLVDRSLSDLSLVLGGSVVYVASSKTK